MNTPNASIALLLLLSSCLFVACGDGDIAAVPGSGDAGSRNPDTDLTDVSQPEDGMEPGSSPDTGDDLRPTEAPPANDPAVGDPRPEDDPPTGDPPPAQDPPPTDEPPPAADPSYLDFPEPAESYVKTQFFEGFDGVAVDDSTWLVATWREHGGQTGPERCFVEDGYLKMYLVNDSSAGLLSSAIQTRDEFYFGRWEARIRPSDVPGVLNSMFTIDWDDTSIPGDGDGTKQEIDIEFLTYAFTGTDGKVHYALHAAGLPSSATNPDIDLGFDPSADFHVWGFDVRPDRIDWFVDDRVLMTIRYDENPIRIDAPYVLKFNVWSQAHWINGPPEPDVPSEYLIDWVRFTPYLNGL